jgi:NAD(P)-dependent dehydrogenase (short-subunit alcohol dehydrogenase family)
VSRVQGKVAIVTGAASNPGLGRAIALVLAREGARVVATDVDEAGVRDCAAAIRAAGGEALALRHDVTRESDWREVVARTLDAFGRLDVLVNNAGIAVLKPLEQLSLEDWNRQIEVNLTSVFLGCKHSVAALRRSGGGSIVNLSSVAGLVGLRTCVAYGASKGGVRIATKAIALELGRDGIRCNSVHPGFIWTNMQARATGASDPASVPLGPGVIPLGRIGEARDVAECVLYLASDESKYVTGAELTVDGGLTAQ